jgi:hypothetical protein
MNYLGVEIKAGRYKGNRNISKLLVLSIAIMRM